ncbi:hypothetical protein SSX86_005458 [Deinandra increscens subsp. villosa]|uniref:WAT1-related protein n=1 Tax=Deinandra increscens subsp. villosa TaxID=3103831 RepID=A0AAP0DQJ3_9ASTR
MEARFQLQTVLGYFSAVHLQGPLFVSVFNPLVLVFVAIAGFLVLDEKLYVGRGPLAQNMYAKSIILTSPTFTTAFTNLIPPFTFLLAVMFSVFGFTLSLLSVLVSERSLSECKLGSKIRLVSAILQGISSLVTVCLAIVVVRLQGPLFVSVFSPLVLVFVAIAGFLVLDEKLYVGSLLGSAIVVAGLYLVLWGKSKDAKRLSKLKTLESSKDVNVDSNAEATMTNPEIAPMARSSFSVNVDEGVELPAKSPREKLDEEDIVEEV